MKTRELQKLWWDWLGTSERLLRSLHEQTAALTLRDAPRVERIQPEIDTMMSHLREIDDHAAAHAKKLAEDLGSEPNLRSLVCVLEKAEAQQVQALANRVTVAARTVEGVVAKNKKLLENELTYIHGTMAIVAKVAQETNRGYAGADRRPVLVDQVA